MRTVVIANRDRACRTSVLHLGMSWGAALVVLAVAAPAPAQQYKSDRDLLTHQTCTELSSEDCSRLGRLKEGEARHQANKQARRNKLLRLPPLPDERNVLLGSWRLEDAGRGGGDTGFGQKKGAGGADAMLRELWTTLESNPDKLFCNPMMFGHGITFASSSYSIQALDGSVSRSSIDYRSTEKQVIVAIPGNMEMYLLFQIAGPNRILLGGPVHWCGSVRLRPMPRRIRRLRPAMRGRGPQTHLCLRQQVHLRKWLLLPRRRQHRHYRRSPMRPSIRAPHSGEALPCIAARTFSLHCSSFWRPPLPIRTTRAAGCSWPTPTAGSDWNVTASRRSPRRCSLIRTRPTYSADRRALRHRRGA